MANYFQIFPPLVFSYRLFIFTNRGNFQVILELEFEESLPRKTASIFKEIGQESNGAANQEKQIFLLCQISPSASSTRDLGTRLMATRTPGQVCQGEAEMKGAKTRVKDREPFATRVEDTSEKGPLHQTVTW